MAIDCLYKAEDSFKHFAHEADKYQNLIEKLLLNATNYYKHLHGKHKITLKTTTTKKKAKYKVVVCEITHLRPTKRN